MPRCPSWQSDVLSYAHSGTDLFTEAETSSQWVAGLYNETVQIISAPGIKDVSRAEWQDRLRGRCRLRH